MANTSIDTAAALKDAGLAGAGGDLQKQMFTLTATDATATWSVTGVKLTYITGFSFAKGQDAPPTADDEGNYYIDQDKDANGYWVVANSTLPVARVIQGTGGTLAADNVSFIIWGY